MFWKVLTVTMACKSSTKNDGKQVNGGQQAETFYKKVILKVQLKVTWKDDNAILTFYLPAKF